MGSDHAGSGKAHEGRLASGVDTGRQIMGGYDAVRFAKGCVGFREEMMVRNGKSIVIGVTPSLVLFG